MKPQSSPERELKLLVEDYGTRTGQWLEEAASRLRGANGTPQPRSPSSRLKASSQDVHLLLDDYRVRSTRWWQGFDKAAAGVQPAPGATNGQALDLEVTWDSHLAHPRARIAAIASLVTHTALLIVLLLQPRLIVTAPSDLYEPAPYPEIALLAPPDSVLHELTQPSPNEGPPIIEFEGPKEAPAPALVLPEDLATPTPAPEKTLTPEPPEPTPDPEPPKIEVEPEPPKAKEPPKPPAPKAAQSPNPDAFRPNLRLSRQRGLNELPMPRRPSRRPSQPPQLALEDPKSGLPGREGPLEFGSLGLNARPGQIVQGAIDTLSAGAGPPAKQAVGDTFGTGGLGGYLPPSSGNTGSNLELLSDPKGVDFRPYLIQILATVRRNWYAVVPESARLGMSKGIVNIQLAIVRNGTVSKLVIAKSSGASPLDRAAVAGISASNPFPPLPSDYAGTDVRLQFAFLYNIKKR